MNVRIKSLAILLVIVIFFSGCSTKSEANTRMSKAEGKSPAFTVSPTESVETNVTSKENYLIVKITYIGCIYFKAQAPWENGINYIVIAELDDEYSVGDYVQVVYDDIYEVEDNQYEINAKKVVETTYVESKDTDYKPVIYLYPKKEENISVKLEYQGVITVSSPEYKNKGWEVKAFPDGRIIGEDGKEYPYIFWEGIREMSYEITEGFCVSGKDTESFLRDKLTYMGLTEAEATDFINFWLPYMKGNTYNLISFQGKAYTDNAKLTIKPKPDSILRVYMVFKPLKKKISVKEQKLSTFKRKGFSVIEWGGTIQ
ncbi:MAG: hypothetical protein Q4F05_15070 [bacterium]|nr:hypothetical protein [bacterium]